MHQELQRLQQGKILVIGDVMLDRYWIGDTQRISPEAPVPVVKVNHDQERPGGAGNVALNIHALGAKATLLGVRGSDETGDRLETSLHDQGIDAQFVCLAERPTISKLRVISLNQQLLRLDFESSFQACDTSAILTMAEQRLSDVDVLILSDYGKGSLEHRHTLITLANKVGVPVLVDPKGSDFSIYQNATLLTPNRKEFEAVVGPYKTESEFEQKGMALIHSLNLQAILITRGAEGMSLIVRDAPALHLPTRAREVYDVTGAGDTVIAVLATGIAAGFDLATSTMLANRAAGVVVAKLGAATVSLPELRRAMSEDQQAGCGVVSQVRCLELVEDAKAHGEKIVMTNGCFDILHRGHVEYLRQAKALGDRLIIAVNDDASVARLKGATRPINSLEDRMQILAELSSVDWVVSFSEDTPEKLIKAIMPDVLVKGGDYQVQAIAGAETLLAAGHEVIILPFVDGRSTSQVIKRIVEGVES